MHTSDMIRRLKTSPPFQGYAIPPSWIAVTKRNELARSKSSPTKSIRRTFCAKHKFVCLSMSSVVYGKCAGSARWKRTKATRQAGALKKKIRCHFPSYEIIPPKIGPRRLDWLAGLYGGRGTGGGLQPSVSIYVPTTLE
jgi:hypothetical protein